MGQAPGRGDGMAMLRQIIESNPRHSLPGPAGPNVTERVSPTEARKPKPDLSAGIAAGARVYTLDGAIPIEFLEPGDRIVTRSGTCKLKALRAGDYVGALIRILPGALGHDRPGAPLLIAQGAQLMMRDWRVQVIYGKREALLPAQSVVDGHYVTLGQGRARLFVLEFETPEVIYVDGVEMAAAVASVDA